MKWTNVIAHMPPETATSLVSNTYARRTVLGTSEFANSLVKKTTSTYSRTPFETSAQVSKRTNDAFVSNRANELSRLKANKYQKVSQQQRNAFSHNHVTNIHFPISALKRNKNILSRSTSIDRTSSASNSNQ